MTAIPPRLEAKLLYRRLDSLLGGLEHDQPPRAALESFLGDALTQLQEDLRLTAALLYGEQRDGFELLASVGEAGSAAPESLDPAAPALLLALRHRVYIYGDPDASLVPGAASAAVVVGRRPKRHLLVYQLGPGWVHEELDFALNTIRAALGARLMEERLRGSFKQAAEIQQSLLVEEPPVFAGYEIACRSIAADEVGGDFFDFIGLGDDLLGLAVGDASGHGLPAALLVRDVVTGLRMGLERSLKVAHVFEKLNRVIHRSNLSIRFVSVFYAELDPGGTLSYVNAGHAPPLIYSDRGVEALSVGGTVVGPLPEARYRLGIARIDPGALLVLCSDGVLERRNPAGEFFGGDALRRVVEQSRQLPADLILERALAAVVAFGDGRPWEDDATLVVVRRLPASR